MTTTSPTTPVSSSASNDVDWLFTSEELLCTPSIATGYLTPELERERRRQGCAFIQEVGQRLQIPYLSIATAVVYFHRFYCMHSFKEYDRAVRIGLSSFLKKVLFPCSALECFRKDPILYLTINILYFYVIDDIYLVGAACIFLAGKTEETFKKVKDVVIESEFVKHRNYHKQRLKYYQYNLGGATPATPSADATFDRSNYPTLNPESEEHAKLRDVVFHMERILLYTLGFDLKVEHPYKVLFYHVKSIKGDKKLAQVAWNFVNDSYRTTLSLYYKAFEIAAAAVYLAAKFSNFELPTYHLPPDTRPWWEAFGITIRRTELICKEILDLYSGTDLTVKELYILKKEINERVAIGDAAYENYRGEPRTQPAAVVLPPPQASGSSMLPFVS